MIRTPLELVRLAAEYLGARGVETPRLDAEVLLAWVLKVPRIQLYLEFEKPLGEAEVGAYREATRRRARREPVAYITGRREFWSLPLRVDPRVLVPRPETERLVEVALDQMGETGRVLDLGVGSGAVLLALLSERAGWTGVGIDASPEALEVARDNAARLGFAERLELRAGNGLGLAGPEPFGVIVSNPPYVPSAELDRLAPEVSRFEPRLALDGGPDGLDVIRQIAAEAPAHLAPGGVVAVEFGVDQAPAVRELFLATGAYETVAVLDDYAGHPRVAKAIRK